MNHIMPGLTSIELVMPSSHLILCRPLFLLPPTPPSIRVFSNESTLQWGGQSIGVSASASALPRNTQGWSPLEWTGWISLQSKGLSRVFSYTTVQKHQFSGTQLSSQSNSHIHTILKKSLRLSLCEVYDQYIPWQEMRNYAMCPATEWHQMRCNVSGLHVTQTWEWVCWQLPRVPRKSTTMAGMSGCPLPQRVHMQEAWCFSLYDQSGS